MIMDPMTLGIGGLLKLGEKAINHFWPDENERAEQMFRLEKLAQDGKLEELRQEVSLLMGQMQINMQEAKHQSIFVAGWRPFVGWVCGFGLAYAAILDPLIRLIASLNGYKGEYPEIDTAVLVQVLMGMLGLAVMRTREKEKKVDGADKNI